MNGGRDTMSIGETITRKRKALGMTQKDLAEKLSVSFQAVSKWETDASHPDVELLPALNTPTEGRWERISVTGSWGT